MDDTERQRQAPTAPSDLVQPVANSRRGLRDHLSTIDGLLTVMKEPITRTTVCNRLHRSAYASGSKGIIRNNGTRRNSRYGPDFVILGIKRFKANDSLTAIARYRQSDHTHCIQPSANKQRRHCPFAYCLVSKYLRRSCLAPPGPQAPDSSACSRLHR